VAIVALEFLGGESLCSVLRNQRQKLKQRSKEFYLQRNNRKVHTERCVVGPRNCQSPESDWNQVLEFSIAKRGVCFGVK
jgi:hypothetical protein